MELRWAVQGGYGGAGCYYMAQAGGKGQAASDIPALDEPVDVTIMRDLRKLAFKLKYVVLPQAESDQTRQLKDWDLWGPLFLCILLAFTLSLSTTGTSSSEESGSIAFGIVFTVVWVGAAVITLNAQLLGSSISFFQSVCVLGYCLFPVDVGAILGLILGGSVLSVRFLCVLLGCVWSVKSACGFLQHLTPEKRWKLTAYPVLLFYVFLSWLVMLV